MAIQDIFRTKIAHLLVCAEITCFCKGFCFLKEKCTIPKSRDETKRKMSKKVWFDNWLKPSNLIALAMLVVTAVGVWGGIKLFTSSQEITGEEGCEISDVEQQTSSDVSSSQKVNCSGSKIQGVKQEQN